MGGKLLTMKREVQLNWLLQMARTPGWLAYAWHRAKECDKNFPNISKDPELLRIMLENKSAISKPSTNAQQEKREALVIDFANKAKEQRDRKATYKAKY